MFDSVSMGRFEVELGANNLQLKRDMDRAKADLGNGFAEMQTMARSLNSTLGLLGVGISVAGVVAFGKELTEAKIRAEALRTAMDFGTGGRGGEEITYLRKVTGELGLQFQSTASSYARFAAAARGTAIEGENTRKVFESVAKASAVMGLSAEQNEGVLLALGQMISKGTVQAEELRGQLGERLPGAFQIAARSMGVTTEELGKLLEQGLVPAGQFLPRFAEQLNRELGGAVEAAADRTEAAVNRLGNAWERAKELTAEGLVRSEPFNAATAALDELTASVARSRKEGAGWYAEMREGQLAFLRGLGLLSSQADSATLLARQLREAEAELQRLQRGAQENPGNIFLGQHIREAQQLVDKLREAQRTRDELAAQASGSQSQQFGQVSSGIDKIAREGLEAQAKAAKLLADARSKALGVDGAWLKTVTELNEARRAGHITEQQYVTTVQQLTASTYKQTAAAKQHVDAMKEVAEQFQRGRTAGLESIKTLEARNTLLEQELLLGRPLTEAERELLELRRKLAEGTVVLTGAERTKYEQDILRGQQMRDEIAWLNQTKRANDSAFDAITARTDEIVKETQAQKKANAELGLSDEALTRLRVAELQATAATKDRLAAVYDSVDPAIAAEYRRQAEALRGLAASVEAGIGARAAQEARTAWQSAMESVESSLTDALMRGFERGGDFGQVFIDTFQNAVKSMVLEPTIRFGVRTVGNWIGDAMGLGGAVFGGGSGGSSALGMVSNASSLYSLYGGAAGGVWGSSAAYGAAIGTANVGAGSQAAMLAAQTGEFGFAGTAATSSAAAGAGSGAASWASSLGPYAWAALILYAMFGDFSKFSLGTVAEGSFGPGNKIAPDQFPDILWGNNPEKARGGKLQGAVDELGLSIGNTASFFGGDLGGLGLSLGTDLDREGRMSGIIRLMRDGQIIAGTQTGSGAFGAGENTPIWDQDALNIIGRSILPSEAAKKLTEEEIGKWFGEQIPVVIVQALQESDLPDRFETYFDSVQAGLLTPKKANELLATATAVQTFSDAVAPLGGMFTQFGDLTVETMQKIAGAAGGFDALGQAVAGYYSNFYSAEEQAQAAWAAITDTLNDVGITTIPQTREEFRALVDSLDDMATTADQEAFAALMKVQAAFAQLVPALDDLASASDEGRRGIGRVSNDLARLSEAGGGARPNRIGSMDELEAAKSAMLEAQRGIDWQQLLGAWQTETTTAGNPWHEYIASRGGVMPGFQMDGLFNSFAMGYFQRPEAVDLGALVAANGLNGSGLLSDGMGGPLASVEAERQREAERMREQADLTRELIEQLAGLRMSITEFRDSLALSEYSTLGPEAMYAEAKAAFDSISSQALAGDQYALEQLQGSAQDLLANARAYYGSNVLYAAEFDAVVAKLDLVADRLAAMEKTAQQSLATQSAGASQTVAALEHGNSLAERLADLTDIQVQRNVL